MRFQQVLVCVVFIWSSSFARAADPFSLSATGDSSSVTANGSKLVGLTTDLIDSRGQFASLSGQAINGSLRYGGIDNAILFTRNAAGTAATVSIPSTGYTKSFTGTNARHLSDQIEADFLQAGLDTYAASFLGEVNERTTLGVTDGNPLAVTALMADASFYRFGFTTPRFDLAAKDVAPGFEINAHGGSSSADHGDGYYASFGTGTTFALGDRIGLSFNFDFLYRDIEGASVYELVNTDGLPIVVITPDAQGQGFSWIVTPAFVIGGGWSQDLAAGGVPIGGQITSSLVYHTGPWAFVLANQWGIYQGLKLDFGTDYEYDTDVDQQIIKNGVQVVRTFGKAFVDVGVSVTNFLKEAAVADYVTPDIGVGIRLGAASSLRIGYHGDFGDGFTNNGGNILLFLSY